MGFIMSVVVGSDLPADGVGDDASITGGHVALDVIAGCAMARESVDKLLLATSQSDDELDHMDTVLRLLAKSRAVWMAGGPLFMIEIGALTSIAGDVGVHSTKQAVLVAFLEPGAHKPVADRVIVGSIAVA